MLERRLARLRVHRFVAQPEWNGARRRLTKRFIALFSSPVLDPPDEELSVLIGNASIALAPDCAVPSNPVLRAAWDVIVATFAALYGTKVKLLGRLPWIDDELLARLRRESTRGGHLRRSSSGRRAGLHGRILAIDPRLMRRVAQAMRRRVAPNYKARYVYYRKPGDYFFPHPDDPEDAVNVLVCIDRRLPKGTRSRSAFVAYRLNGSVERHELSPGQAIAVEARGVVHAREPMGPGERITLLSIGVSYPRR